MSKKYLVADERLVYAFNRLVEEEGGNKSRAAKKISMSSVNLKKIITNKADVITAEYFSKALPYISAYLDEFDKNKKNTFQPDYAIMKDDKCIAAIEVKSVASNNTVTPVINVQLSAKELDMLEEFRKISTDQQRDATTLISYWSKMDNIKKSDMIECAKMGKTCKDSIDLGEVVRGLAPLSPSASTVKIPHS